ncbi:MAG: hypothetical protein ACRD3P_06970, partial [Terriglobales bacterium]
LQFRTPTPQTEHLFETSFNAAFDQYKVLLAQTKTGAPNVPDMNLDTDRDSTPGTYFMNDNVHARLLEKLAQQNFVGVTAELRTRLLQFFSDPNAPYAIKRKPKQWNKLLVNLERLKHFTPAPVTAESLS